MKKIAIIGQDSFIGSNFYQYLKNKDYKITATTIDTLDITDKKKIKDFIKSDKFEAIVLFAGSKNVAELEKEPEIGYRLNVEPVQNFVDNITDERFIFMSSDYVFDGKRGRYKSDDKTCPDTVYGKNKAESEEYIINHAKNYAIVRTAGVLGEKSVFLNWLLDALKHEKELEMYKNSYFSPTCINFLCEVIEKIINDNENKIYHAVEEKRFNRYELALKIKDLIKSDCKIIPTEKDYTDRSLEACEFVKKMTQRHFEEYLEEILCIK